MIVIFFLQKVDFINSNETLSGYKHDEHISGLYITRIHTNNTNAHTQINTSTNIKVIHKTETMPMPEKRR